MCIFISWLTKKETWNLNISEAVALLAVLIATFFSFRKAWRSFIPFTVTLSDKPYADKPEYSSLLKLTGTPHKVTIRVYCNTRREISDFNVSCMERIWWNPFGLQRAPEAKIVLSDLQSAEGDRPGRKLHGNCGASDGNGGCNASYASPVTPSRGSSIYLQVTVVVKENWRGYMSFDQSFGDENRRTGICALLVRKDANSEYPPSFWRKIWNWIWD